MGVVTSSKFIIRVIECLFAIVTFACVAATDARSTSSGGFQIFTGVAAFLLTLLFMALYFSLSCNSKIIGLPELVVNFIITVFFFAGSIAIAAQNVDKCGYYSQSYACSNLKAATAFGFFSFFLWAISAFLSWRDMKTGGASSANV